MTKTLLNGTNEILKRVGIVSGDAVILDSLTDSARQRAIDVAVQAINEGVDELFSVSNKSLPLKQGESTIVLSLGVREYSLADDVVKLRWPFIDRANAQYLAEYPGGYNKMLVDDMEQDDEGLPHYAAIRETDGKLYLDRAPTTEDAGRVYVYQYDREFGLEAAADVLPFNDAVFRAMVPVWVQLWKREMRNEFDNDLFKLNIGRAARFTSSVQPRRSYNPRRG